MLLLMTLVASQNICLIPPCDEGVVALSDVLHEALLELVLLRLVHALDEANTYDVHVLDLKPSPPPQFIVAWGTLTYVHSGRRMCISRSLSPLHAHRPVGFPDAVAEVDGGRRLLAHEDRVVALQAAVLRRGRDGQSHAHEQRHQL